LFQATTSSASWRVRIALALKGISYDGVWVDLYKGEHLGTRYSEVSPINQVPCLEIDGHRLFQSVAIVEYLEETRPKPQLLPEDPLHRATVRGLTEVVNSLIQPMHNFAVRERLKDEFEIPESSTRAWCRYWIERRFVGLNRALEASCGKYSVGDSVTMADIFLYPQIETSRRFDVDVSSYPTIVAILNNLQNLSQFHESHTPET
jgi:maleylacetoacetate isomerase